MSSPEQENKERNREIAHNEAVRSTTSAVRVSGWAIAFAILFGAVALYIGWALLNR